MFVSVSATSYAESLVSKIVGRVSLFFFFQAEDGIRDLVRSRGLGDVYKRQGCMIRSFRRRKNSYE